MADLTYSDALASIIAQQRRQESGSNPYAIMGSAIGSAQTPQGGSMWEQILGRAVQGMLAGGLTQYGSNQVDRNMAQFGQSLGTAVNSEDIAAAFKSDPALAPYLSEIEAARYTTDLANKAQMDAMRRQYMLDAMKSETDVANAGRMEVAKELGRRQALLAEMGLQAQAAGAAAPNLPQAPTPQASGAAAPAGGVSGGLVRPPIAPLTVRQDAARNDAILRPGATAQSAEQSVANQFKPEMEQTALDLKTAQEEAQKGGALVRIGESIKNAQPNISTGPGRFMSNLVRYPAAMATNAGVPIPGGDAAIKSLEAEARFDQVTPEIISALRAPGSGSISNYEDKLYQAAAPSSRRIPQQNLQMAEAMIQRGKRNQEYANFLQWYATKYQTTAGAPEMWQQYEDAAPFGIVTTAPDGSERLEKLPQVPTWRDFVTGQVPAAAAPGATAPAGNTKTINGATYQKVPGGWQLVR